MSKPHPYFAEFMALLHRAELGVIIFGADDDRRTLLAIARGHLELCQLHHEPFDPKYVEELLSRAVKGIGTEDFRRAVLLRLRRLSARIMIETETECAA